MGRIRHNNIQRIYLNNAATNYPRPRVVVEAVNLFMRAVPPNPMRTGFTRRHDDILMMCREKLADLFNVTNPDNIIFTSGATESANLVMHGLELEKGHIITTTTEHNSVLRPLKRLERQGKVILSILDCDRNGKVPVEKIETHIQPNTKAIIISHCSNVTGQVQNLREIAEIAGKNDIWMIVDAAQSAGILPIDVAAMGIDILIFTGHKYLYGLAGTGGLCLSENIYLKPLKVGGTGIQAHSLTQPDGRPVYYESGTHNYAGIIALSAGLDFMAETGIDIIQRKITGQIGNIRNALERIPEIEIFGPLLSNSFILSFNIKGLSPLEAGHMLENSFGIMAGTGLHCAPLIHRTLGTYPQGTIRISPSYFTTDDDIQCLNSALEHICSERKVPISK